jgi:hypothetical protein
MLIHTWKQAKDVTALARLRATSFAYLQINLTLQFI